MKFKIGDKVKIVGSNTVLKKNKHIGYIGFIERYNETPVGYILIIKGSELFFWEEELEIDLQWYRNKILNGLL